MHSDCDIDERRIFRNGGLNLHIGGLPNDDRVASFRFLKSTPRKNGNSKKTLDGRYCTLIGPCHRTIRTTGLESSLDDRLSLKLLINVPRLPSFYQHGTTWSAHIL